MVTTAEAWDLWREACCDERGGHHWSVDETGREYLHLYCRCCPTVMDVHPEGGEILLPWGLRLQVRDGTCERCGDPFQWATFSRGEGRKNCAKSSCRHRPGKKSRAGRTKRQRQRRQLKVCAERGKKAYQDERSALGGAISFEHLNGERLYPYECPCGSWHLTGMPPGGKAAAAGIKRALFGATLAD